jgi:uncharacterized protein YaiL (DUF2058 family)
VSEQPTPETDAAVTTFTSISKLKRRFECSTGKVSAEFARRLERERDEAIRQRDETNRSSKYSCDYNYEQKLKAERERDEAREQVKELIYIAERAIALAEIDFENDKFGVVSELRGGLEKIKEETK